MVALLHSLQHILFSLIYILRHAADSPRTCHEHPTDIIALQGKRLIRPCSPIHSRPESWAVSPSLDVTQIY